ncbi:MAG: hypothetical protein HYR91_03340 [Flavobacteriia bacterium]|nr:hypothetical protein [Flavobacteriia bacterium]
MIVQASINGVIKIVLMILGAFVLLRFLGQLAVAKRNMEEERSLSERQRKYSKEKERVFKSFGKTSVISNSKTKSNQHAKNGVEDVDFEEID